MITGRCSRPIFTRLLAHYSVNLFMLNLSPSGTGFAVAREQYGIVKEVFDGLVVPVAASEAVYLFQVGTAPREVETQASLLKSMGHTSRIKADPHRRMHDGVARGARIPANSPASSAAFWVSLPRPIFRSCRPPTRTIPSRAWCR